VKRQKYKTTPFEEMGEIRLKSEGVEFLYVNWIKDSPQEIRPSRDEHWQDP